MRSLLPDQRHLVLAPMNYSDRHVKEYQSTATDFFLITDVITLYARAALMLVIKLSVFFFY